MAEPTGPVEQLLEEAQQIAAARGHEFARRLLDEAGVTETLRSRIESLIGEG